MKTHLAAAVVIAICLMSGLSARAQEQPAASASDTIYFAVYKGADRALMESEMEAVSKEYFNLPVKMIEVDLEVPQIAYVESRKKYYAGKIIDQLKQAKPADAVALIALVNVDIFVGGKPYIRGLGDPKSGVAVVSEFRFKGASSYRIKTRILKELLHELGHAFGQEHCDTQNWCVMGYSQEVDDLDMKYRTFCHYHKAAIRKRLGEKNIDLSKYELPMKPVEPDEGGDGRNGENK